MHRRGFGFFFGGLAQFCAGLLNYQRRNTFGCVAFCCFGSVRFGGKGRFCSAAVKALAPTPGRVAFCHPCAAA